MVPVGVPQQTHAPGQSDAAPGAADISLGGAAEPLRSRRRRELRQHISDVATQLFLLHGFDAVRVADVARASGVTEKTVYNHFPTKESLLVDRWDGMTDHLIRALADLDLPVVDAAVGLLDDELDVLLSPHRASYLGSHLADMARFSTLVRSTPSLRAHQHEALDHLTSEAAAALASRRSAPGPQPADGPEDWMAATALAGLWTVFYRSLHHHLHDSPADGDPASVRSAVRADLERAAHLLRHGM